MKREKGNRREWIKMLNIAICDDDIQITGTIENLVRKIANKNFVEVETEVFWNGQGLLDAIINANFPRFSNSKPKIIKNELWR